MIEESIVIELLRTTEAGVVYHREGQELEYKEQFNLGGLSDYFKDFAGFANNKGGFMIYGVSDAPKRRLLGLNPASLVQFEKIDPERISGFLLNTFSGNITWEQSLISLVGKHFGVFKIHPAQLKPIIAKKDEGKDNQIKNGEIYYRYAGRTQKIEYAELELIINHRIEKHNNQWLDLMSKIGRVGVQNAAIFDAENGIIEKNEAKIWVIDEELIEKLKFIKEGSFVEKTGAPTLKLIGDVVPIDRIEVVKKTKENLLKEYPLTAEELAAEVKQRQPTIKKDDVWKVIRENQIKGNKDYAVYNFRSLKHEEHYQATGKIPSGTPSIYKKRTIDLLIKIITGQGDHSE